MSVVDSVSARLTDAELRTLNGQLGAGTEIAAVAERWLRDQELT